MIYVDGKRVAEIRYGNRDVFLIGQILDREAEDVRILWTPPGPTVKIHSLPDKGGTFTIRTSTGEKYLGFSGSAAIFVIEGDVYEIRSRETSVSYVTSVDFSQLDLSRLTNLDRLFSGFEYLEDIVWPSYGTASGVGHLESVFRNCKCLKKVSLRFIETSKFSNTSIFSFVFSNCSKLESIDFGKLTIESTVIGKSFDGCDSLKTIRCTSAVRSWLESHAEDLALDVSKITFVDTATSSPL